MSRVIAGLLIAGLFRGCATSSQQGPAPRVTQARGTGDVVIVIRGKSGVPIPTCTVLTELQDRAPAAVENATTIDDADDRYVLHDVPAGRHVVTVVCGDEVLERTIEVRTSGRTELHVSMDQFHREVETLQGTR